jgi:hypothetical protein
VLSNYCLGNNANYTSVFTEIAEAVDVAAPISCQWVIPEPPAGQTLDPDFVNFVVDLGSGSETIGRVDDASACAGVTDGWYYDDPTNPTTIFVCPQTCTKLQAAQSVSVSIQFGCETIPAG